MVAADVDVDRADLVGLVFIDLVDDIDLSGLFEEPRSRLHFREQPAEFVVLALHVFDVLPEEAGVEHIPGLEALLGEQGVAADDRVPFDLDVANLVTDAFGHLEDDVDLALFFLFADFRADLGVEVAEVVVVLRQGEGVGFHLVRVIVAAEPPQNHPLGFEFRLEDRAAEFVVSFELDPPDLALLAFDNREDHIAVGRLVTLRKCDFGVPIALVTIDLLDALDAFLVRRHVEGVASHEAGMRFELAGLDLLVSLEPDVIQDRPLDKLEDQDRPLGSHPDGRFDAEEQAGLDQCADVFFNLLRRRQPLRAAADVLLNGRLGDCQFAFDLDGGQRLFEQVAGDPLFALAGRHPGRQRRGEEVPRSHRGILLFRVIQREDHRLAGRVGESSGLRKASALSETDRTDAQCDAQPGGHCFPVASPQCAGQAGHEVGGWVCLQGGRRRRDEAPELQSAGNVAGGCIAPEAVEARRIPPSRHLRFSTRSTGRSCRSPSGRPTPN